MIVNRLEHSKKIFSNTNWASTKDIVTGDIKNKFSPILTLDLTEKCNYFCDYCVDKKNINKSKARELRWDFLKVFLPEIRTIGCRCIEVTGGGEPTLYTNFKEFLTLASELGFHLALVTNGSMLDKYIDSISASSIDWIRVSLDSSCENTHKRVHSIEKNIFGNIIGSIEKLSKTQTVGISFIIREDNFNEIYSAAKISKSIGAKYIEFKPLLDKKNVFAQNFDKDYVSQELERCKADLNNEYFEVVITDSIKSLLNDSQDKFDCNSKKYDTCFSCYYRTVLTPSGLYPCSYFRGSEYNIKNIKCAQDAINARNALIKCVQPNRHCKNYCARSKLNDLVLELWGISIKNKNLFELMGWPVDYGDDWVWL